MSTFRDAIMRALHQATHDQCEAPDLRDLPIDECDDDREGWIGDPLGASTGGGGVVSERLADRLSNYEVDGLCNTAAHTVPGGRRLLLLAREVQASRRLIAELRVEHEYRQGGLFDHCVLCGVRWPCPTIALIEEAGL